MNRLAQAASPYLRQHAGNPVDWYPWGEEAFRRAREEDKPIFLSIGYSTCHWCHVMARESFEDREIAALLNAHFVAVKVDREERPDIDSIYMAVCQAFTGSGGWPTTVFITADQRPFFAGTYFPKTSRYGTPGLKELLEIIADRWKNDRAELLRAADEASAALRAGRTPAGGPEEALLDAALAQYRDSFDDVYGGFGSAPKFPAPHNLDFLLRMYETRGDEQALQMAEKTLLHMYSGGMFDHIGYGFCRYSTDRRFLVPHFEKMLYDNALLLSAYCHAFRATGTSSTAAWPSASRTTCGASCSRRRRLLQRAGRRQRRRGGEVLPFHARRAERGARTGAGRGVCRRLRRHRGGQLPGPEHSQSAARRRAARRAYRASARAARIPSPPLSAAYG